MTVTSTRSSRSQAERVRETRGKLIAATVAALDEQGFAATSISVVQARAGVSRGALMHHFATRSALIAATAEHLLQAAIRPTRSGSAGGAETVEELIAFYWQRIVNTPQGRAFIEILLACRTDADLRLTLGEVLTAWDADISNAARERFAPLSNDPEDAALLWSIGRAFLRGMIVHAQFNDDPAHIDRMIARFGAMLGAQMSLRPPLSTGDPDNAADP